MANTLRVVSQNGKFRATLTVWRHNLLVTKSAGGKIWVDEWTRRRLGPWWFEGWVNVPAQMSLEVIFRCKSDAGNKSEFSMADSQLVTTLDLRREAYGFNRLAPEAAGPFREIVSVEAVGGADLAGEVVRIGPVETAPA